MKIIKTYSNKNNMLLEKTLELVIDEQPGVTGEESAKVAAEVEGTLGDDVIPVAKKSEIELALDRALVLNRRYKKYNNQKVYNVCFVGIGGIGKTAKIRKWAKENDIKAVWRSAPNMEAAHVGGAIGPNMKTGTARAFATEFFDQLDDSDKETVLILDEYNRGLPDVRGTLLTLIQDHRIPDSRYPDGQRYFPNMLFTIAAINPADKNYETYELDDAEKRRFEMINVETDQYQFLSYLNSELARNIKEAKEAIAEGDTDAEAELLVFTRQKALANALLNAKEPVFDTIADVMENKKNHGNGLITTNSTFEELLDASDGYKDKFISRWSDFCNDNKLPLVKKILNNYTDIDDKANAALKQGTESSVFATNQRPKGASHISIKRP